MASIEKYQTNSGTRYRVRLRVDGKSTQRRGFLTKRQAKAYAVEVEHSKKSGAYVSPTAARTTIGVLGPAWLHRQQGHLKPSSQAAYESAWRNQVLPRWGDIQCGAIRFSDVQAWVSELSTRLGAESVLKANEVFCRILDDAVKDHLLTSNPARGVKRPRAGRQKANTYLTAAQLQMLGDAAGSNRGLVLLLGVGGLRWGEAMALRVQDIDFLRRRISLHRNVTQVRGQMIEGTLKSNKSRVVVVPTFVIEAVAATAEGKARGDLLWPNPSGGYQHPQRVDGWLSKAVAACQERDPSFPRVTPHDLRHTAASLAISARANPKAVQRMLGHASAAMTLDVYADLFDSDLDAVAENVAKLWPQEAKKDTSSS